MTKIDSHVHFWQLERGDYSWMTTDMRVIQRDFGTREFESQRQAGNVSQIILVQAAPTVTETRYLFDLARSCDYVAGVVGKVDIEKGSAALEQLDEFVTKPLFCGIRPMLKNMGENRWLALPGLDAVIVRLMQLELSFECMVRPDELDELTGWLTRYPQLRAVLSHGGMPDIANGQFTYWADKISHIARETQIYCKLSGLMTQAADKWDVETLRPYTRHLLDCFGYERLIWGSDWPVMLCAGTYQHWCSLCDVLLEELGEDEKYAVYVDNAQRFYKLNQKYKRQ